MRTSDSHGDWQPVPVPWWGMLCLGIVLAIAAAAVFTAARSRPLPPERVHHEVAHCYNIGKVPVIERDGQGRAVRVTCARDIGSEWP